MVEKKTIILGIDGATWDIIKDYVDKGDLPTFEKLMKEGVWGPLESCIPPMTGPAWTAIATGKNQGKTGIFDFLNRTSKNSLTSKSITSQQIKKAKPFWDILSENNYKIGIWNYPFLFPPYEINGFMISGLGSPSNDAIFYPKNLKTEISSICKNYEIHIPHASKKYVNNERLFIKDISELLTNNENVIEFLLKNKDVNLFFGVISAIDFMQHYLWNHVDKNHPLYKEDNPYKDEFLKILKRIDKLIYKIKETSADNTNIFLVSDHGFGPQKANFYINQYLANKKLLKKIGIGKLVMQILSKSLQLIRNLPEIIKTREIPWYILLFDIFDTKKSIAINLHSIGTGGIFINPAVVKTKNEYIQIREKIIKDIKETTDSLGIKCEIFLPEDIYKGEYVELAPDILLILDDLATSIYMGFNKEIFTKTSSTHGQHRMNGIFLAYGPDIKKGEKVNRARLYDIAPTMLHLFDLPIPDDVDGNVLTEIFKEDSEIAKRKPRYSSVNVYDDNEKEKLKKIIKDLKLNKKI